MVSVPEVVFGCAVGCPGREEGQRGRCRLSLDVGVSVILHSSSYSSAVPVPVVAVVQAGLLDNEVAYVASEGRVPECNVMDAG